jgi:hypothetical protein
MRAFLLSLLAVTQADGPREFATINEAALFAFQYILKQPVSTYYEYGGQIVQMPDGKYALAMPDTDYSGDRVSYSADPDDYKGKLVASYHTHPCLPDSHVPGVFSGNDIQGFRVFNRPGFLLDLCTGDVHYWAPGDPVEPRFSGSSLGDLRGELVAKGKIVAHIDVSGKSLEKS